MGCTRCDTARSRVWTSSSRAPTRRRSRRRTPTWARACARVGATWHPRGARLACRRSAPTCPSRASPASLTRATTAMSLTRCSCCGRPRAWSWALARRPTWRCAAATRCVRWWPTRRCSCRTRNLSGAGAWRPAPTARGLTARASTRSSARGTTCCRRRSRWRCLSDAYPVRECRGVYEAASVAGLLLTRLHSKPPRNSVLPAPSRQGGGGAGRLSTWRRMRQWRRAGVLQAAAGMTAVRTAVPITLFGQSVKHQAQSMRKLWLVDGRADVVT
mmetsp:Transcript_522/g.1402  ORF Transcript_522/g.1402 Transcript_522/m.1402 type:complete len:273 (-) Transcript_522:146-964(-)